MPSERVIAFPRFTFEDLTFALRYLSATSSARSALTETSGVTPTPSSRPFPTE